MRKVDKGERVTLDRYHPKNFHLIFIYVLETRKLLINQKS